MTYAVLVPALTRIPKRTMRVFSARRAAFLLFALLALFALVAAETSGTDLEQVSEEEKSLNDAELESLLGDAESLGFDTGDEEVAATGSVEPVPAVEEDDDEDDEPDEPTPDPEPEALPEPVPEPQSTPTEKETQKETPKPVAAASPSANAQSGKSANKGPPPSLVAKPGQEPGPCAFCKASAHKLQVSLHGAHRDHHSDDEYEIDAARVGRKELPEETYVRHMRDVCGDKEYWGGYRSYQFESGQVVLTGSGLDWSALRDPRARETGIDHSADLMAACAAVENEAEKTGLYHAFWQGKKAYTGRKWFFQDAFCGAKGHACHVDTLREKHEEL